MSMKVVLLLLLLALHSAFSIVFPLTRNVCPTGPFFTTTIEVGKPSKPFELQIDTGSVLTWVQCYEPSEHYDMANEDWYKPPRDSIVQCEDPLCAAIQEYKPNCTSSTDRCEYVIDYEDDTTTHGYLVRDHFSLQLENGSVIHYPLVFGCGYKQIGNFQRDGILGLSIGAISFTSQMNSHGLIQPVTGHCLSGEEGGGFLFLGDNLIPATGVSWMPITNNPKETSSLLFDELPTQVNRLQFIFDSGASYSYLGQAAYDNTLELINRNLEGTPLKESEPEVGLPVCWGFEKIHISSFNMIKKYFKKLTLSFIHIPYVKLDLPLPAYLTLVHGKVCLGIQDGDSAELENPNIIGVISMQNQLVIYDNVNHRIGWISRNCNIPLHGLNKTS